MLAELGVEFGERLTDVAERLLCGPDLLRFFSCRRGRHGRGCCEASRFEVSRTIDMVAAKELVTDRQQASHADADEQEIASPHAYHSALEILKRHAAAIRYNKARWGSA